ncbi:MAG TPA: hypothetical protein VGG39_29935 [Polyangiaceae bacterium]|jgi:hypothetical protein
MKRVWGKVIAAVSLLGCGVASMAACKHDDSTLFVEDVLLAPLVTSGQQCLFTNDPTQPHISSGVLDYGLRQEYDPTYLIGNQSVPEVNSQQLQTETNIITVQGAIVRITDSSGTQLATFTRLASATVYPSSGSVPGYAPITVTTIDSTTLATSAEVQGTIMSNGTFRVVTYVKFFGQTTGGNYIESDEFEFPVDVCYGCLVGYSAADENPQAKTPNCLLAGASASTSLPSPCVPGQDFTLDCSQCLGLAVCQGQYATQTFDAGTDAAGE